MSLTFIWILLLGAVAPLPSAWAYVADWSMLDGRPHEPTCVDIPRNMSLCSDIGYDKMRLPNLLNHDTLTEVQHQSGSWVPLLNVKCHPHTKLFLCSLFTPVCLESQIYPCRSLCQSVQTKCESRMKTYGYHWPDMLRCDKFPEDNDMCIKPPKEATDVVAAQVKEEEEDSKCGVCQPVDTFENILDNFCRAQIVIRAKVRKLKGEQDVSLRKSKILKSDIGGGRRNKKLILVDQNKNCCNLQYGRQKYIIMGDRGNKKGLVNPTFILPWKKNKPLRKAVRLFKNLNCTDPNLFTPSVDGGTILPKVDETLGKIANIKDKKKGGKVGAKKGRKKGERKRNNKRRRKQNKKNGKKRKKNRNNRRRDKKKKRNNKKRDRKIKKSEEQDIIIAKPRQLE